MKNSQKILSKMILSVGLLGGFLFGLATVSHVLKDGFGNGFGVYFFALLIFAAFTAVGYVLKKDSKWIGRFSGFLLWSGLIFWGVMGLFGMIVALDPAPGEDAGLVVLFGLGVLVLAIFAFGLHLHIISTEYFVNHKWLRRLAKLAKIFLGFLFLFAVIPFGLSLLALFV